MVSNSIESAQKRVEGNNFDLRKNVVEYDDVINKHREAIYKKRREILNTYNKEKNGEENDRKLSDIILEMVKTEINQVVDFHTPLENKAEWNLKEIYKTVKTIFNLNEEEKEKILDGIKGEDNQKEDLKDYLSSLAEKKYENMKGDFSGLDISFIEIEKGILLRSVDNLWVEHLETIDYLRRGIGLRGYGQRDPLVEYKKEAYRLYHELLDLIQKQIVYSIYKTGDVSNFIAPSIIERAKRFSAPLKEMARRMSDNGQKPGIATLDLARDKVKNEEGNKVGRNDLCPCGSGKKFKKCCGK